MVAFTNIEYTIELTEAIAKSEETLLMIPDKQYSRFKTIIQPHLKVYAFKYPRVRQIFANIKFVKELVKRIQEYNPDIVHIQKGHPYFNYALPKFKKFCLISTIHDVELREWASKKIPEFTHKPPIRLAAKVIVHGEKLRQDMIRINKRAPGDVHVTRRGVNSIYTRFIKNVVPEEKNTILFYGRIWEYKGLKYLIEAEPLITAKIPDAKIIIAGMGQNFDQYEKLMVHKDRFIVYNEFISSEMTAELFQRASLVVLPYTSASQSGIIPQAYAFKKPVVATNVGSLAENLVDGKSGIVVPPRDTQKLANAIIEILGDEKKLRAMSQFAYDLTLNELNWDNIAKDNINIYKEALRERKNTI